VFDGRGAGATAILYSGRVHGFKRGFLSFIKKTFEPTHERVVSLRGNPMTENGFVDDLAWMTDHWGRVSVTRDSTQSALSYADGEVTRRFVLRDNPLRVVLQETYDGERLVERYTYADVSYNPVLDLDELRP